MQNEEKKVKKSFFQNMKAELKKVIWPTGKQTVKSTFITIGFVLLISAVLIVLNYFFNFLSSSWYNLILGDDKKQNIIQNISGDVLEELINGASGEEVISGDLSGEKEVIDVSGEV